ncbi:MAG TPA: hypothetical protein VF335_00780 [Chitinivibrionales bacterium]
MDDALIISQLTDSYSRQVAWYRDLSALVQKTLSQLVLSRGSVAGVMVNFEKKQSIFSQIAAERLRISDVAAQWQVRKASVAPCAGVEALNRLLGTAQTTIQEFLDAEDQLKKYLEHIARPRGAAQGSEAKSMGTGENGMYKGPLQP